MEPTTAMTTTPNITVVVTPIRSMGVAIILTIMLGPVGLFYASVLGGFVMLVLSLVAAVFTFGPSLFLTWPSCVVWAMIAVGTHDAETRRTAAGQSLGAPPDGAPLPPPPEGR